MNFVSWAFVALFLTAFAARLTIGRRKVESSYLGVLLLASLVFYSWHIPAYLAVLLGSATVDYVVALRIHRLEPHQQALRRAFLVASLVVNLGLLAFFKYGGFAVRVAEEAAALSGTSLRLQEFSLVLPMGISFYTFQTLSYTIDVYRGVLAPLGSFPRFLLFISFFPQLVAGPIVRASEFLPQLPRPRRLHARAFYQGAWLVVVGFFLKMVCADNLAAYVDEYWERGARPGGHASFALWLSVMFSGQIFTDFAGYSTIAQGLGYLLGFRFPDNFNAPYLAGSFKNFWERWHMTLSRWLRDYLYLPLGGNRHSRSRTLANLLAVMLLGGLWHGAAYTFIVWGAIHGLCLVGERVLGLHRIRPATLGGASGVVRGRPGRGTASPGSISGARRSPRPRPSSATSSSGRGERPIPGCCRRCCSCCRWSSSTPTRGSSSGAAWPCSGRRRGPCWRRSCSTRSSPCTAAPASSSTSSSDQAAPTPDGRNGGARDNTRGGRHT